jgi:small-conductance mechanosensitive channel
MIQMIKIIITTLFATTLFTGCDSAAQKVDDAHAQVQDANQNLKAAQANANADAQTTANTQEWKVFKAESDAQIKENEAAIANLRVKLKNSGKILDVVYSKKIETLGNKNRAMKEQMDAYEKNISNWETFKRAFSHDMTELGKALKDLAVSNTK